MRKQLDGNLKESNSKHLLGLHRAKLGNHATLVMQDGFVAVDLRKDMGR